ncbi:protein of unknown function [Amphibacillus marinus]|uniref:DUF3284 domain-containing protein n=1 Tax=Amphibacillus marinus TaxID=872970 RepID=A0A1H8PPF2_9BACI|nr:DUF3284 domain-containing protein [Amphibacillus marinus]SEO43830.1 protein of unknown function [Amphibacillus marinus]
MELVKKMNVPVVFFYQTIIKSVLADIHSQTGAELTEACLENFEYVRTFSKQAKAKIRIEELVKDEVYQFRTLSNKSDYVVTYRIKHLTKDSCELHYCEVIQSSGGLLQKVNDAFVGIIWSWLKIKKFKAMLRNIEAMYIKQCVTQ